jgi:hypothetical protein
MYKRTLAKIMRARLHFCVSVPAVHVHVCVHAHVRRVRVLSVSVCASVCCCAHSHTYRLCTDRPDRLCPYLYVLCNILINIFTVSMDLVSVSCVPRLLSPRCAPSPLHSPPPSHHILPCVISAMSLRHPHNPVHWCREWKRNVERKTHAPGFSGSSSPLIRSFPCDDLTQHDAKAVNVNRESGMLAKH